MSTNIRYLSDDVVTVKLRISVPIVNLRSRFEVKEESAVDVLYTFSFQFATSYHNETFRAVDWYSYFHSKVNSIGIMLSVVELAR